MTKKEAQRNAALNGGRGSGQTVRRITELYENKIADLKANCDLAIEGRDVKIMELEDHLAEEVELHLHAEEYIKSLEQQIEKMKFWHSKTEMEVVRDVLTEYINNHESFDVAIFNVRNRLNGRLKND